jgi:hypothetical protein
MFRLIDQVDHDYYLLNDQKMQFNNLNILNFY